MSAHIPPTLPTPPPTLPPSPPPSPPSPPPRGRVVAALGIVQILTFGSTYYLLAVLATPIAEDTGWSRAAITGGISLGLLIAGLSAGLVARIIRERGGRAVLLAGVGLLVAGLTLLAMATSLPVYYGAWVVIGAGMAGSLYEAAFSTLGVIYGAQARGAITRLTLWAGFASTVCWPLSALLVETIGWRGAALGYAALHLGVTIPLCWFGVPRGGGGGRLKLPVKAPPFARLGDARFVCLALAGICLSVIFAILSVHLLTLLTAAGLTLAAAVGLGALIGPAQVGARVLEMLGRERHHPIVTLIVAASCICVGLAALRFHLPAGLALVVYGAGTGLFSIARGTVPLAVFGPEDYPLVMGQLALPILLASAAAPLLGADLIARLGPDATLSALALLALVPLACALAVAALVRRR